MWIMLTEKLPTVISPPMFFIFWAEKDLDSKMVLSQIEDYLGEYEYKEISKHRILDPVIMKKTGLRIL